MMALSVGASHHAWMEWPGQPSTDLIKQLIARGHLWAMKARSLGCLEKFSKADPLVGRNVQRRETNIHPHVVPIIKNPFSNRDSCIDDDHFCIGTLVSFRHVLTAAHCFDTYKNLKDIKILVASPNLETCKEYPAKTLVRYRDWTLWRRKTQKTADDDIAILVLDKKVRETYVEPARLSTINNIDIEGKKVEIVSWGSPRDKRISRTIEIGFVKILTPEECTKEVERASGAEVWIDDTHFCTASRPYLLATHGDSGGPVLYHGMIVGVNKGICPVADPGTTTCIPKAFQVNIHMSVHHHREFISDVIQNWFKKQ
ncbi:hypothetical protein QAD02_023726 [Eretmocerus hayati]|uniref:Uncharacterized protein n=1 Tax=Eretmocerus hayati TaxID=131215 RepID=A0ACC2PYB5_9HYME|nr:hypothetical protein QAD02_023726 [Eretmocerus hayati]